MTFLISILRAHGVKYLCKKRCTELCPIPKRFSTPAASRLCLQKVLDFHTEISVFLFLVFKYFSGVGRLSSVRRTNSLTYEDWTFTSYYSSLHSTRYLPNVIKIGVIKRISGHMCFYLAVPKFYLELAESRQNLWLSEWELSLSQKKKCLTQWHSQKDTPLLQVKKVKWCTYHFYRVDFLTPAHPTPHPPKKSTIYVPL